MSAALIDAGTREIVSTTGLGRTLFVEAGAGTGKTTQLVDRVANLVLVEGVPLTSIAAITFTEAAATELQRRIRVQFETVAASSPDPVTKERARGAIAEVDRAAVSTLHGFASRLLNEFAVDAGLPPRVQVLDEVTSQLAHEERWERFVDALYDDARNERVLTLAALVDVPLEPRYPGHATLKDVAAELNQNWDRIESLCEEALPPLSELDFGSFDAAVDAVLALPEECTDPTDLFYVRLTEQLIPSMSAVRQLTDRDRKLRALVGIEWKKGGGGRAANWGGDAKACKDLVDVVNETARAVVGEVADRVLRHLVVAAAREVRDAATARRAEGGLEFHDLLVLAREMLRNSTRAREVLHERFTHLLLDEFQDTDPIQIELAMLIATSITDEAPEHWSSLPVAPGRLFFVGDPKQSIYRFRRADIALYLRARDRFGAGEDGLRLESNFRTVAPVLDWVNALFAHEMPVEEADRQPKYEPLSAVREPSGADHRPLLLGGPHADPKIKADALREAEAASVAGVLALIRDRPADWPVFDRRAGGWRDARLSDVTILVPARTSVPYLRAALEAASVPYRLATGTLVYDTQEVRDTIAALRAIDDPTDELSLVAALRSPLYACSDVDLFTFRRGGGRWDLRNDPPDEVPGDHPVRVAMAHLRSLWELRWWHGPAALVERLLGERQARLLAFGDPRPKEVWHRLRFLADQARAFEESAGGDLRAFIDWAELQGAERSRVHEPLLPETDDDSVSILTIHGSKGLEFPITVLSGMTTKSSGQRKGVSVLWDDSDGPPEVALSKRVTTANHEPRADVEVEMDAHEKLRLLYVACTRARDHLVVSCHHKATTKEPDTYAGRVWAYFQDHPGLHRRLGDDGTATEVHGESEDPTAVRPALPSLPSIFAPSGTDDPDGRAEWIAERAAVIEPHLRPRVTSATAIAREALAGPAGDAAGDAADPDAAVDEDAVGDLSDDPDEAIGGPSLSPRRRGRAGTAIGRAVHATLQVLDLAEPRDVESQVRRQCDLESIPEHVDTVGAMVRSALGSAAVRSVVGCTHHKELFVAAPVGDRVIEGYVDLLVETPAGLVVIDYKTDGVRSEADIDAKLATYELQGASYAAALEHVTGRSVVDCRFVFCKIGGAVERSVADLPAAMTRVRRLLRAGPS